MEAMIDWLSFTVKQYQEKEATPQNVIENILGLDFSLFQLTPGGYGYKKQYQCHQIKVYFEGREDMGVHVLISGNGIRYLENTPEFQWKRFLFLLIHWFDVRITRLDVAVDETEGILDLPLMEQKMKTGEIISRWRTCRPVSEYEISDGEYKGYTLYFGKRSSDILCRFYDKRAEEKEHYQQLWKELPDHWIRCELEMHGERAMNFANIFSDNDNQKPLGQLFAEVLNNYMRVTDKGTDSNKSRWENCTMWEKFITTAEKLHLTCKKPENSLEKVYIWIKKSVSPSLFMLFKASYGDMDFFHELVNEGKRRISRKHIMMMDEFINREAF